MVREYSDALHAACRRLVCNAGFLDAISAALRVRGELRIKTDDAPYFAHIRTTLTNRDDFQEVAWPDDPDYPQTNFERRFRATGTPIFHLRLRKI